MLDTLKLIRDDVLMKRENKFFSTCNGETVQLTHVGYVTEKDFPYCARLNEPLRMEVAKYVLASGGGKPTIYAYAIGSCSCGQVHFAERRIERPAHASNHECNGKCKAAKGPNCECSCKGANHGVNS